MGYYVRNLTPSVDVPSVESMEAGLQMSGLAGTLTVEAGTNRDWTQVLLAHIDGPAIANIERDCAASTDLVERELEEFLEVITDCKPASAAGWLSEYLPTVKTIYAFQVLGGTDVKNGWEILDNVRESIFTQVGGIMQADGEGFTDEDGCHILWQFADSVKGPWWMGVLEDGEWLHFQMDLGNESHRAAFLRGEVPEDVEVVEF